MEHAQNYPGHDIESIRPKDNSLHRKQAQTANPNIPPEILAAKRVKHKIGDKADIGGEEEGNYDLETGLVQEVHPLVRIRHKDCKMAFRGPGTIETRTSSVATTPANPQPQALAGGRESSGSIILYTL